jgi:hypothetical protein
MEKVNFNYKSHASEGDTLENWLSRADQTTPISSNMPSVEIPFQRWFKFKEAFSPQLIIDCVKSLDKPPATCLDPFGGSGTTALTAQFLGVRPTTIEVNPFLADLIDAKLAHYNPHALKADYFNVLDRSVCIYNSEKDLYPGGPATLVQPGKAGRWIYSRSVARRILSLREAIESLPTEKHQVIFRVALGSILVSMSNVIVNGKGRKYRKNWESRQKSPTDVEAAFREAFFRIFTDVCRFATRKNNGYTLLRGDSRIALDGCTDCDFALFSPPYPNSFDYTDIYNLELWMLGYFRTWSDNFQLRNSTLRSHVQLLRDFPMALEGSKTLKQTYHMLSERRKDLWSNHIPEMICAYFEDMRTIMLKVKRKLTKNGKAFIAIGNSKYAGILINTETILMELARFLKYKDVKSVPFRSMRASPQQGGRPELTETLIVLQ